MRIIYDDLAEFAEAAIRCNDTVKKGKCEYCPFFDRCDVSDKDNRHIMFAEFEKETKRFEPYGT